MPQAAPAAHGPAAHSMLNQHCSCIRQTTRACVTDAKWWHRNLLLSERPPPRWRGPNLFNSPPSAADAFNLLHLCTLTLLQRRGCACCGPRRRLPAGQTTPTALLFGCTKLRVLHALAGAQSGYTTLLHAQSRQCQRDSPLCWPASCRRAAAVRRQRTLQRHRCACAKARWCGDVNCTAPGTHILLLRRAMLRPA